MTTTLHIHLLGHFAVDLQGETLTNQVWGSQQTQTIAKILFARRGEVVTSDQLINLVWHNESAESVRNRLYVRISQLRNGLEDQKELIKTVHGGYLFQADELCWVDVDEFQEKIAEGARFLEAGHQRQAIDAYEQARQLYRGDFLAEDLYADWTYNQREFFRERFLHLLLQLSECYSQQGRYRLAIVRARQALMHDPLRETIYVRLMIYHYYAGERDQALRLYEHCRTILEEELEVAPLDDTRHLFEQIKAGTLWKNTEVPHYPPPIYEGRLFEVPYALNEIPFAGRDREYAWLMSQWNDKTKRVILLEGEAGVGKSRLVETFTGYLAAQGVPVLSARLSPTEHTPMAAITAALRGLLTAHAQAQLTPVTLAALSTLFPELRKQTGALPELPELSTGAERQRLYAALTMLVTVSGSPPTLLVVDDAHRLGAAAVDLLAHLSQSCQVLLSYRGEDTAAEHPIRTIFGQPGWKLNPLSSTAIQIIIRQLSGQDHAELATRISAQSGGNPLFAVTLLQHLFETGQLFVNSRGSWTLTVQEPDILPTALRTTIATRLGRLNRVQRRILDFAVVIGGEFDFKLLKNASQQPEELLLKTLDELMDAAVLSEPRSLTQPEFKISHDLYKEVGYETIPAVRRKQMHLLTAQAIETLYAGQLDVYFRALADHFDKAEKTEPAAHYAALAGEQAAAQFAADEALYYLGRALALTPAENHLQAARVRFTREAIHDLQGKRQSQNEDLLALEIHSPYLPLVQQAEIHLRRAGYEWIMGNDAAADAALQEAIQQAKASDAKQLQVRALFLAGRAARDQNQANEYLVEARQLAVNEGQRALEGDIVRCLGNASFWQGNYPQSHTFFKEALSIHQEVGDLRGELSALNNLGHVLYLLGNPIEAIQRYEQAQNICQKINDRLAEGVILTNFGELTAQLGDYKTAQDWLEQASAIRDEISNEEGLAHAYHHLAQIHRQQGHYHHALDYCQKAHAINTRLQHKEQTGSTLTAFSVLYRELGEFALAQNYLQQALATLSDEETHGLLCALTEGSLLNHLCGDSFRALSLGEQALAQSEHLPPIHAAVLKNVGHALAGLQRVDEAQENFENSAAIYQRLGQSHLATEPQAGVAQLCLRRNDLSGAAVCVDEILDQINHKPLQGPDRALWVYLICYQALSRVEDRRASEILQAAMTLIDQRAAAIGEDGLRRSYLGDVAVNREILRLWEASQKPD